MHSLILIERTSYFSNCWENLIRKKSIKELTVEEIIFKYKGFEGDLISFYYINSNNKLIINELFEIKKEFDPLLFLYVTSELEGIPQNIKERSKMVGYDVGVCDEEKTIYSSIFNEVLFGIVEELINYKDVLNENLLFPNKEISEKYVNLHNRLSKEGKDVEDYEEMTIYEIWEILD